MPEIIWMNTVWISWQARPHKESIHVQSIYVWHHLPYKMTEFQAEQRRHGGCESVQLWCKKNLGTPTCFFTLYTRLELSSICTSYDLRQGPTDAPERPSGASISLHRAEKGRPGFYVFGSDMMWHAKFEQNVFNFNIKSIHECVLTVIHGALILQDDCSDCFASESQDILSCWHIYLTGLNVHFFWDWEGF